MQLKIDEANRSFWNEMCGSFLAKKLGIKDDSQQSLAVFDAWYLDYYDYLLDMVDYCSLNGKRVLEIGLGYGTLGQKVAEVAADYTGMDIAEGPVNMMNHRLRLNNLPGCALQGSILEASFPDESFDTVISIGCLHHTGNIQRCVDEIYRLLKPGGSAYIMVYNQFSYRQWIRWPARTFRVLLHENGLCDVTGNVSLVQKAAYDTNLDGTAAPETIFCSDQQLMKIFKQYNRIAFRKTNMEEARLLEQTIIARKTMIKIFGKLFGLDIYIVASK